jgi:Fe-S-cluster containining protein
MSDGELTAGDFTTWAAGMRAVVRGDATAGVPCDGCTACCTSSMFVHVEPDERDTLEHIPRELQFQAPFLPAGHVVLPYDERGHCPMLVDGRCSIYAHRPRTCRRYDCRVIAAARLDLDDDRKSAIRDRVRRWRFEFANDDERVEYDAIARAAAYLRAHAEVFPDAKPPADAHQLAVVAFAIHQLFLEPDAPPELESVQNAVNRR